MKNKVITAAFIIIGDEILSGRTRDENLNFLACGLGDIGVNLKEVRVVPDVENEIVSAVNAARTKYDYVFTSGGVGPTHDDITSAAIAKAFEDKLIKNEKAVDLLVKYYGKKDLNDSQLKMAFIPTKARLIDNQMMAVSGFVVENVFVFAGIPRIFRAMFDAVKNEIIGGRITKSLEIKISLVESVIAKDFSDLQQNYPQVAMGSYPLDKATSLVFRSTDYEALEKAAKEMTEILKKIKSDSVLEIVKSK